ncbi:MAG: TIGR00730 family Rossman fold protein [Puniceicoccales bacterium]|nr:TIGR00730 family Rossman fold protein [Puniceicoccales bacterium]
MRTKTLCIYSGSRAGSEPSFVAAARELGVLCARAGIVVVNGAGGEGLMGAVVDAVLGAGGVVEGVIPRFMAVEGLAHPGIGRLEVTGSMHERKWRMAERADAFVALPGGLGTLDELAEILAWRQLALHGKPVGVLNTAGFYTPLLGFFEQMDRFGFLPEPVVGPLLCVAEEPGVLLGKLGLV